MDELLSTERAFCEKNRETFTTTYHGHHLLVRAEKVYGDFETHEAAVFRGVELFGAGPFLVWSPLEPEIRLSAPGLAVGVPLVADSPL